MPIKANVFLSLTILMALSVLWGSLRAGGWSDLPLFLSCWLLALVASRMKVRLPGITGTISVAFFFYLLAIADLTLAEALVIGCSGALMQCLWKPVKRPQPIQVVFNLANMTNAVFAAFVVYQWGQNWVHSYRLPLVLVVSAAVFFVSNTLQVVAIVSLTEKKPLWRTWHDCYFWCFPCYLVGGAFAGLFSIMNRSMQWYTTFLVFPVVYWIYRSYSIYLARVEDARKHAEEVAELHLRTIEALALAIEAKDETTHEHLERVPTFALALAKEMGLTEEEMDALRAAALLHDIGKLAVPEHIISKPGRLTPEEFEKMKVHPLVGAEILERVQFPYAVVPIVRSHHEKWDGSGYPDGLKGEAIPMGARILSAVDCLDALTSDRQYRKAVSFAEALAVVQADAGKAFDPRVVEVLRGLHLNGEVAPSVAEGRTNKKLSRELKVERGEAPAAGFAISQPQVPYRQPADFLHAIASARGEGQMLFELSQDLGNSLSLDETLSVLAVRLKRLIPHDTVAVFIRHDDYLIPEYVSGENFREFASLRVRLGDGLCGWVAANRKPMVNGNPLVEPGFPESANAPCLLHSALAVPLEGLERTVGVLGLYRRERDAFSGDDLRILLAVSSKLGFSIENALKYQIAENSATIDYLTGLPNARSLFLHLDSELNRSRRLGTPLAVVVCDLDGFKQVNDRFGHLVGNMVLRSVAAGLKQTCREYDYVARMGGDEFVVIMPGFDIAATREKTRLFQSVAVDVGIQVCKEPLLSLSAGIAVSPHDGLDAEQLLAEADRRMYADKSLHHAQMPHALGQLDVDLRRAAIN
jgi:diguanylate cyclase (GGDEF)-like protein/putative nucleotidyltransferase with HDIG domain